MSDELIKLLDEVDRYCAAATEGPFQVQRNARLEIVSEIEPSDGCRWYQGVAHVYRKGTMNGTPYTMPAKANADFFARARTDLPRLSKELRERLEREQQIIAVLNEANEPGDYGAVDTAERVRRLRNRCLNAERTQLSIQQAAQRAAEKAVEAVWQRIEYAQDATIWLDRPKVRNVVAAIITAELQVTETKP